MMIYICSFQRCQLASGGLLLLWLNYATVLKLWRSLPSYSWDTHISNIWPPWKKKISLPAPSVESTLLPVSKHLPSRWPWELLSLPSVLLSQMIFFLIFLVLFGLCFVRGTEFQASVKSSAMGLISLALGSKSIVFSENCYLMVEVLKSLLCKANLYSSPTVMSTSK